MLYYNDMNTLYSKVEKFLLYWKLMLLICYANKKNKFFDIENWCFAMPHDVSLDFSEA